MHPDISSKTGSIHTVDLVIRPRQGRGGIVLPWDYYQAAMHIMESRLGHPVYFVFSDDWDWARGHFRSAHQAVFVEGNSQTNCHEDLRLMSLCRHHIIANSSFSWWAAWLSEQPDNIVIAPKYWMVRPDTYYPELFPKTWNAIPIAA